MATSNSAHQAVVGWNNSSAVYIASPESCELKKFIRYLNKVERNYIQEQKPNQFHYNS